MSFYRKLLNITAFACITTGFQALAGPNVIPKEMAEYFPIGRTFNGVKIPSYSNEELRSILEAATVTRVDDVHLKLTKLIVKAYNSEGEVISTVKMDKANYSLLTNQLLSETPAKISHEKFVMTGDQLGYDTTREVSTMKGNVKTVVQNVKILPDFEGLNGK